MRAVDTKDFMTAMPTEIDFEHFERISKELMNLSPKVSFVGYEITTKPPATIELI